MAADAFATMSGNVVREPEWKDFGENGVCNFTLAVNKRTKKNGEWTSEGAFWNIAVWGEMGRNVLASVNKGDRVTVSGVPHIRSYEKSDGSKGLSPELTADEISVSLRWSPLVGKSDDGVDALAQTVRDAFAPVAEEQPF